MSISPGFGDDLGRAKVIHVREPGIGLSAAPAAVRAAVDAYWSQAA